LSEGNVSADPTAVGLPATRELQMSQHAFDDNSSDNFCPIESVSGAATKGETDKDGGNAPSETNRMFPIAARQELYQTIDTSAVISFAGTANTQSIDKTDRSTPIDREKSLLRLTIILQTKYKLPFKRKTQKLLVDQLSAPSRRLPGLL
jgi:hypothetical protein